jgi:hypothetical protein
MLASCVLEDGGVIIMDDFLNPAWLGVPEATILFLNQQDKVGHVWTWISGLMHFPVLNMLVKHGSLHNYAPAVICSIILRLIMQSKPSMASFNPGHALGGSSVSFTHC